MHICFVVYNISKMLLSHDLEGDVRVEHGPSHSHGYGEVSGVEQQFGRGGRGQGQQSTARGAGKSHAPNAT